MVFRPSEEVPVVEAEGVSRFGQLKDFSFGQVLWVNVLKIINASGEDFGKYMLAVDTLECLLDEQVEHLGLVKQFEEKRKLLEEKFVGESSAARKELVDKEFYRFKLSKLVRLIQARQPKEMEGEF